MWCFLQLRLLYKTFLKSGVFNSTKEVRRCEIRSKEKKQTPQMCIKDDYSPPTRSVVVQKCVRASSLSSKRTKTEAGTHDLLPVGGVCGCVLTHDQSWSIRHHPTIGLRRLLC